MYASVQNGWPVRNIFRIVRFVPSLQRTPGRFALRRSELEDPRLGGLFFVLLQAVASSDCHGLVPFAGSRSGTCDRPRYGQIHDCNLRRWKFVSESASAVDAVL